MYKRQRYCGKSGYGKIEAAQADEAQAHWKPSDPFFADAQKSKQQERQVIYEHDLAVHVEETAGSHEQYASAKRKDRPYSFSFQPEKAEEDRDKINSQHVADEDGDHGNPGQQASDEDIRAEKAIIRDLISVAASAQRNPGWQKSMLIQAGVPYGFSKRCVLAQPVGV